MSELNNSIALELVTGSRSDTDNSKLADYYITLFLKPNREGIDEQVMNFILYAAIYDSVLDNHVSTKILENKAKLGITPEIEATFEYQKAILRKCIDLD